MNWRTKNPQLKVYEPVATPLALAMKRLIILYQMTIGATCTLTTEVFRKDKIRHQTRMLSEFRRTHRYKQQLDK